jgi:hypothetical protein
VKVKGAPLKGQGTGPPAGSARNIENKFASPVICPHIWSRLPLKSQKAAISDTSSNQQLNSQQQKIYVNQQKKSISIIMDIKQAYVLCEYHV